MPRIKDMSPVPMMYPEDLRNLNGDAVNPWASLEDLAHDQPSYKISEDGGYVYKQSTAMNQFQVLKKQAEDNGDLKKAQYYEEFMRSTLERDPIEISEEDFNKLSDAGKMKFYRLSGMQAKLEGDEDSFNKFKQLYGQVKQQHMDTPNQLQQVPQNEAYANINIPVEERVHFGLSDAKVRHLLQLSLASDYLPNSSTIYNAFSDDIAERGETEPSAPVGFNQFGVNFLKKQLPNYSGPEDDLREAFLSPEYQQLSRHCIKPQFSSSDHSPEELDNAMQFIHCYNPKKAENYGGEGEITGRFYLSPQAENIVPIMEAYIQKSESRDLPYYFKFSTKMGRNDRIVIYSGKDTANVHLATLQEIQQEHPEWFENSDRNPLWGSIEGTDGKPLNGVYYGAEPPKDSNASYGSRRAEIFAHALDAWRSEFNKTIHSPDYNDYYESIVNHQVNFSDEEVKRFKELFAKACQDEGLSPRDFATGRV